MEYSPSHVSTILSYLWRDAFLRVCNLNPSQSSFFKKGSVLVVFRSIFSPEGAVFDSPVQSAGTRYLLPQRIGSYAGRIYKAQLQEFPDNQFCFELVPEPGWMAMIELIDGILSSHCIQSRGMIDVLDAQ